MSVLDIIVRVFTNALKNPVVSAAARYAVRQATAQIVRSIRNRTSHRKNTETTS